MPRRLQFSLMAMLSQVTLVAIGLFCLQAIGESAGPFGSVCLIEISVAATGAAIGILFSHPWRFAAIGAFTAIPLAILLHIIVEGIGC